jgi:Peptidase family M23
VARGSLWLGLFALVLAACTEQLVVRPEGEFSWEPEAQLIWPVEGAIVGAYGESSRSNHQGVDLAAHPGDPVAAALLGDVAYVGEVRGYGNVVALAHGDRLTTVYAHLGETRVQLGDRVIRGQTIGTVGEDGYLHYEIRNPRRPVDPAQYYATAPRPVVGGSANVDEKLRREPSAVGVLGVAEEAPAPPPPVAAPTPTQLPRVAKREPPVRATVVPTRTPTSAPTPTPSPEPAPTRLPRAERTPRLRTTPLPTPEPTPVERTGSAWSDVGMGAAVVGANLFYVPAKLAYATIGGVTGGFALVLAHDKAVADRIWSPSLRGDYFVTPAHLRGEEPLHFIAAPPETPAPPAPQKPVRRKRGNSGGASRLR